VLLDSLAFVAVLCTATFAGAALYITLVEHPVRMGLETRHAALQWAPSYRRATLMQAPLAVVGCLAGLGVAVLGGGAVWVLAALLIGSVVPFTLVVIAPTNRRLLDSGRDPASAETRALLGRWGALHAIRAVLSLLAVMIMMWQLVAE
jgi:hypothetical protein